MKNVCIETAVSFVYTVKQIFKVHFLQKIKVRLQSNYSKFLRYIIAN